MDDETVYGPAMRVLNERQRQFVLAMAANPFGSQSSWARAAGYSTVSQGSLRVQAHTLAHDPKVQAAVEEVARDHLTTFGPLLASAGLLRIARDKAHPKHLRALEMIANRTGLHETTEHRVSVTHSVDPAQTVERIKRAAAALGVDPATLLGANSHEPMKLIEGEIVDRA